MPASKHGPSFVMPFGKYKGKTLGEVSNRDPSYILWMSENNVLPIDRELVAASVEYKGTSFYRREPAGHSDDDYEADEIFETFFDQC